MVEFTSGNLTWDNEGIEFRLTGPDTSVEGHKGNNGEFRFHSTGKNESVINTADLMQDVAQAVDPQHAAARILSHLTAGGEQ